MKASNNISRAERRRKQKNTNSQPAAQKSIMAILLEFLNYQRVGVLIAIVALIIAYPEFKNNVDEWRRDVDVVFENYSISNDEKVLIYYLLPDMVADLNELEVILPLMISNKKSKNVSNLTFQLSKPLSKEQKETIYQQGDMYMMKHHRFSNKGGMTGVERKCCFSINTNAEVVMFKTDELNSHMSIPIHESLTIYPNSQQLKLKNNSDKYYTPVKDYFTFQFYCGFRDMLETFRADISVCGLNYNTIDELIDDIDQAGRLPFYVGNEEDEKRLILQNNSVYVILPQVINNVKCSYNISDVEIYKLEYASKKFKKQRQLTIENNGNTKVLKFKAFDESKEDISMQMSNRYKVKYI